jgi:O-antigen/teichoic acid export membrane protein
MMDDAKRIQRSAFVWNTAAGLLTAFQSVIWLIVITRTCDLAVAGVFTIAFALANQFLNIGRYGMRNFQATDTVSDGRAPRYSFGEYLFSRTLTTGAMIVVALIYLAITAPSLGYPLDKVLAILLMTLLKAIDTMEDVFFGNYQQYGRLDVAGRLMFLRNAVTIVLFGLAIGVTADLVFSLALALVGSIVVLVVVLVYARRRYALPVGSKAFSWRPTIRLLWDCAPLFVAGFLIFYIGNTPRYAIDAYSGDVTQALYGFIATPVFVVTLIAGFVYTPIVAPLSALWAKRQRQPFLRQFAVQVLWVLLITAVCVLLAWLLGVPVLSWLYNTDVSAYLQELCVLVGGGGFLALATLFTVGVTIVRKQNLLLISYGAVSLLAALSAPYAVQVGGIWGASWIYLGLMALLALATLLTFIFCIGKDRQTKEAEN